MSAGLPAHRLGMPQSTSLAPSSLAVSRQDTPQGQGAQLPHRPAAARAAAARAAAAYRAVAPWMPLEAPVRREAGCGWPSPVGTATGAGRGRGTWLRVREVGAWAPCHWHSTQVGMVHQLSSLCDPTLAWRRTALESPASWSPGTSRGHTDARASRSSHLAPGCVQHRKVQLVVRGSQVCKHIKHGCTGRCRQARGAMCERITHGGSKTATKPRDKRLQLQTGRNCSHNAAATFPNELAANS